MTKKGIVFLIISIIIVIFAYVYYRATINTAPSKYVEGFASGTMDFQTVVTGSAVEEIADQEEDDSYAVE